jgi:hypothetical protein
MDFIENLKKIGKDWRLLTLVIWMLIGVALIPYPNRIVSIIGIIVFLPFIVFLMFLFLLSLKSKKDIFEYPSWKIILFLLVSLPIMLLISILLAILFAISIITYFFFTSWFIIYACYLIGKNVDKKLHKIPKARPFLRIVIFLGGLAGSLALLYLFIIAPSILDLSVLTTLEFDLQAFPWYLNGVYILVGGILIGLAIISIIYLFKKSFPGWFGLFAIMISFYTLFLVLKIYLGIVDTEENETSAIWAYISMIIPDMLIIFYSLSTLMGSQSEFLDKRFKRFRRDTVLIWLILSKVAYEFIHYFPYEIFGLVNIPWVETLTALDNDLINLGKNIAVLGFFILLLLIISIYEMIKSSREEHKKKEIIGIVTEELTITNPDLLKTKEIRDILYTQEEFDRMEEYVSPDVVKKIDEIEHTYEDKRLKIEKKFLNILEDKPKKEKDEPPVQESNEIK